MIEHAQTVRNEETQEARAARLHQKREYAQTEIKAIHSGPRAHTATSEDAGGLDPVVHIAQGVRVMLTSNLWVDTGLVNGTIGTVQAIYYQSRGPPDLLTAVMVSFDSYSGPTMHDGSVAIVPKAIVSFEASLGSNNSQGTLVLL